MMFIPIRGPSEALWMEISILSANLNKKTESGSQISTGSLKTVILCQRANENEEV